MRHCAQVDRIRAEERAAAESAAAASVFALQARELVTAEQCIRGKVSRFFSPPLDFQMTLQVELRAVNELLSRAKSEAHDRHLSGLGIFRTC